MGELSGHGDILVLCTKIDSFEQKDSQGFENSYNYYEHYPLRNIFTIYQIYRLALSRSKDFERNLSTGRALEHLYSTKIFCPFRNSLIHKNMAYKSRIIVWHTATIILNNMKT